MVSIVITSYNYAVLRKPSPKVSVVMSTFCRNHAEPDCPNLLRRALDSIRVQTFPSFELILIDDGSTDGSEAMCREYAAKDSRIRYVRHETNSGRPALRYNEGMKLARADYFAFMFDDDMWYPNALMDLYAAIWGRHKDCGMVYGGALWKNAADGSTKLFKNPWSRKAIEAENILLNLSAIVKRSVIDDVGGYDEGDIFRVCTDWDLWVRIGRKYKVAMIDSMVGTVFHNYPDSVERRWVVPAELFPAVKDTTRKLPLQGELHEQDLRAG